MTDDHRVLDDKVAIVTGASRGIGKQVAIDLARRGASVVAAARTVERRKTLPGTLGETIEVIEASGGTALAVPADMASEDDLERLVATAVDRFGGVDVLVNNAAATAGRSWGAALLDLTREQWMDQYAVNLHAPFSLIRAVVPIMRDRGGGRVLNLTTAPHHGGVEPLPGLPMPLAYPSSKAALDEFCHAVAPQLQPLGIAITNVHPGFVRTEMVDFMEGAGLDASAAIPMAIPTRALSYLATCESPMAYTGQVVAAEELLRDLGQSGTPELSGPRDDHLAMKIGVIPAAAGAVPSSGAAVAEFVVAAEESGFDSVWVGEHPALPVGGGAEYPGRREGLSAPSSAPLPDPLDWLAFAAAHTERLLLGTAVVILPLHSPVVLAKRVATVDQLSGGRVRLGVGVGWNHLEYEACGAAWERRGVRADECIGALRALWKDDEASFSGELVRFDPVYSSPKPLRYGVPVLVGASSDAGARRAGRLGDGFLPFERDHDRLVRLIDIMRSAAAAAGRDPNDVEITVLGSTRLERVRALAELGVHRMLLFEANAESLPGLGARLLDLVANAT